MAQDEFGRAINYLRISITDRCNLRCIYCMPQEGVLSKGHFSMMTYEEIVSFVRIVSEQGIRKIRITGGEPLVRKGVADLISELKAIDGIENIALTTNATLLSSMACQLKDAGLDRVNISLDTLDPKQYSYITRRDEFDAVISGIDAALEYGFDPVKINAVSVRALKQDYFGFAKLSIKKPLHIRFIEYMPVGGSENYLDCPWSKDDIITGEEIRLLIDEQAKLNGMDTLKEINENDFPLGAGPAKYYAFPGAKGTVGFISAMSNHFCSSCNRMRLTSDGKLRPCLFSDDEYDIMPALRSGDEQEVLRIFKLALEKKPKEHLNRIGTQRQMSAIGG